MRLPRRARLGRLGLAVLLTLGIASATSAPPAKAFTKGVLAVQGVVFMGSGLAYPCLTDGFPGFSLAKCIGSSNAAAIDFSGTGTGAISHTLGAKCVLCGEGVTLAISAGGSATGACGFSSGYLSGTMTPGIVTGPKSKSRAFAVTFSEVGGVATVTGSTSKGETIAGKLTIAPSSGSCTNKASKAFTVAGSLTLVGA